jgi:glycosyltransferase involved in cell wall biosynthesis
VPDHSPAGRPDTLAVPRALDLPDPGRRFSAEAMRRKLNVLFVVSQPNRTPAISVHATLMRFLNHERVAIHVLYNRLAAGEPYRRNGTSVLDVLPRSPDVRLRAVEFGPVGGAPRRELAVATARAAGPAIRDVRGVVRYIRRNRIDVIHCEEGSRNGFYAYALSRVTPARCVLHFHLKYGSWMSSASRLAVQRADAVIPVSSWAGQGIHEAGVPAQRIFPVLNGIEPAGFDPAAIDGAAIRGEFGLGPSDTLIVSVAQLVAWKRQHMLIEAFGQVASERPNARLLLVGTEWSPAPVPGASYTAGLQRLVAELGLERRVIFAGHRRDVRQILKAADIFALPSVGEPFGLVFAEAMAMAKPVVSVRTGGTPEVVLDGETGLLGPVDDVPQLSANLLALIDDPALRHRLGEHGRRRVLEYLNAQRMADDVEAVYRLVRGLETAPAGPA